MRIQLDNDSLSFDLPWQPLESCPCGSGQPYCYCCNFNQNRGSAAGLFLCERPVMKTPGFKTEYAHDKCYLSYTEDCDRQISKEHHISKNVLEQLGDKISLSGAIWQGAGEVLTTTAASLQSKTLCVRHNSALSCLDTSAGRSFKRLREAANHAISEKKVLLTSR